MRVMVLMKATEASEQGLAPTPEMLEAFGAMDAFTEELNAAGILVARAGLKRPPRGRLILVSPQSSRRLLASETIHG